MNEGFCFILVTVTAMENKQLTFCMVNSVLALNVNPRRYSSCHRASQSDCFYLQSNASFKIQYCLFKLSILSRVVFKIIILTS